MKNDFSEKLKGIISNEMDYHRCCLESVVDGIVDMAVESAVESLWLVLKRIIEQSHLLFPENYKNDYIE